MVTSRDANALPSDALDDFYRELDAVYSGVFSSRMWGELLGDDFSFEQVTEKGTSIHAKAAFVAQLKYLAEHAVGRIFERETQREQRQFGNPSVYRSATAGGVLDPQTGQASTFAHENEIIVCFQNVWRIAHVRCRDL